MSGSDPSPGGLRDAVQRKGSFLQTVKAVGWSFFGIRQSKGHEQDVARINPVHLVIAGLLAGIGFVVTLAFLVRWVVSSGAAL